MSPDFTLQQRMPRGAFLIRESNAIKGYVVSVNTGGDNVAHVKAEARDGGLATVGSLKRVLLCAPLIALI